jgi:broad specificity phosphatase PhoE
VTTIELVRHGETDWNRENRFQGHADPPLNAVGMRQAEELARALDVDGLVAAYSSPLRRALETARILARALGLEVTPSEPLREVDVGSWQGLTRTEVQARFPEGYRRWRGLGDGWEGGEMYEELGRRVIGGIRGIADLHVGRRVLVVTHGGPIRSALAAADGVSFGDARRSIDVVGNCAVVRLAVDGDTLRRVAAPTTA